MLRYIGTITVPNGTSRNNTNTGASRLDLGTLTGAHFNVWLRMIAPGVAGDDWTISAAADSPLAGGVTIDVDPYLETIEVHFEDGVSTIADFEAAVAALTGASKVFVVDVAGTGATVLAAPGDDFPATHFAGGAAGAFTIPKTTTSIIVRMNAASMYFEAIPDGDSPSSFETTAATGLPLGISNPFNIQTGKFGVAQVAAVFNGSGGSATCTVWATAGNI